MKIDDYQLKKAERLLKEPTHRVLCQTCAQPDFCCYCKQIVSFDPNIHFVILIHPLEVKRRIATGRMSHLCLEGSHLIKGLDFTHDSIVNALIEDSNFYSVILFPGSDSKNMTLMTEFEKQNLVPTSKKLRIFVIDGTWATAGKMIRMSENLKTLLRVCFSPPKLSNFRVRKQPNEACYSTIEAIHHTIELMGSTQGFNLETRQHDHLLSAFDFMVERQLIFIRDSKLRSGGASYRRPIKK